MKVLAFIGDETFDGPEKTEEAYAGWDRREPAWRRRDAECRQCVRALWWHAEQSIVKAPACIPASPVL